MDVGIRELKAHLSDYVRRAQKGEVIVITDHGRPTAVLAPLPTDQVVEQGVAEGWIAPPSVVAPLQSTVRRKTSRSVAELLTEDRGS